MVLQFVLGYASFNVFCQIPSSLTFMIGENCKKSVKFAKYFRLCAGPRAERMFRARSSAMRARLFRHMMRRGF